MIWLFFDGRWGFGIFMLAWGLLLGGLDNVLRPLLISGRARISALAVFVGVLGGIPAFGAIGIIAGPVVLSLVLALIEFAEESRPRIACTQRKRGSLTRAACKYNPRPYGRISSSRRAERRLNGRRWPRRWAPPWCWPAPAAARPGYWCIGSPG